MKKLFLLLMVVMLLCSACSNVTVLPQVNDDITKTVTPHLTLLTSDEARVIAQVWLDEHPEVQFPGGMPNIIEDKYSNITVDNEEYYLFNLDNPEAYWFNILVHTETGTLLHRFMPDGEFPSEEIEPLDDWYNRFYGE